MFSDDKWANKQEVQMFGWLNEPDEEPFTMNGERICRLKITALLSGLDSSTSTRRFQRNIFLHYVNNLTMLEMICVRRETASN